MSTLRSTIRRLSRVSKDLPVFGAVVNAAHAHYWRRRTAAEWAADYQKAEFVVEANRYPVPTLENLTSQLCTAEQITSPLYRKWCSAMRSPARMSRKQWEFVFVLQALDKAGMLSHGKRGLGFGCGQEPIPAVLAKHGAEVIATDQATQDATDQGWVSTQEHTSAVEKMSRAGICDTRTFLSRVGFEFADMNVIPKHFAGAFDFTWSCCAFEHLGSIRHGLDFVKNSVECLRPGGIAVHTTEFNLSSKIDTLENPGCVIFRECDMRLLIAELEVGGHEVLPLNLNPGGAPIDNHIDAPPYSESPHLKVLLEGFVTTSIGLIVRRKG